MIGAVLPATPDFPHGARDLTACSPVALRRRMREPSEIGCIVLHQTGFQRRADNPRWRLVAAHAVVLRSGEVLLLHPMCARLTRAANSANASCISVEIEGNLRSAAGRWWSPEKFGRTAAPTAAQIESSLALGAYLAREFPIEYVHAHRQFSRARLNCPGPQVWTAVGEPLKLAHGLSEGPTGNGWCHENGTPIHNSWRAFTPAVEQPAAPLAA